MSGTKANGGWDMVIRFNRIHGFMLLRWILESNGTYCASWGSATAGSRYFPLKLPRTRFWRCNPMAYFFPTDRVIQNPATMPSPQREDSWIKEYLFLAFAWGINCWGWRVVPKPSR